VAEHSRQARVGLRDATADDIPILFEHQVDPGANRMAAFPARDRQAFTEHWTNNVLGADGVIAKAILFDGQVVGNLLSWVQDGQRLVGYWIGRDHWGQGIASAALAAFVAEVRERPLVAHVAKHNAGSIRVLKKSGFVVTGEDTIELDGQTIEEFIMTLEG